MTTRLPQNDPIRAHQRHKAAVRRVGIGTQCVCGEARAEALIREREQVICHECKRKEKGMKPTDGHHNFGEANSSIKIEVPVNDHRARLSVAQYDWPPKTLENPDASPLLAAAATIRGFIDTVLYLIDKGMHWIADMLEKLDGFLTEKFGNKWWINTPLEKFVPRR